MNFFSPSIEQLVTEIIAVNHAWKETKELFDSTSPLAISFRDLKTHLQVRLLRKYAPEWVYLVEDTNADSDEPLYGLQLIKPTHNWKDAAHLPIRVAQEVLSLKELQKFIRV